MTERSWKILRILFFAGICTGVIRPQYGAGFALGGAAALLIYWKISRACDAWIMDRYAGGLRVFSGFMGNYAIMAGVLILAALKPQYFNIFTAAAGLGLIKLTAVAELFLDGKGERHES